ncbi:MAG: DUF4230 domain-containing protein [Patescibacteria group bacterium]
MFTKVRQAWMVFLSILALVGIGFITWFIYTNFVVNQGYYVDTSGTAVVKEVQQLGRLETSVYSIEKVIDAGTQGTAFQQFLFGDKILLIANGQVIAGIDFSQISEDSITEEEGSITVNAPAPQIFFTRLDNEDTRVYDRTQGLLTKGETDLESEARAQAEIVIREAACEAGILESAEESARKQLTGFLQALGYTNITINIPKGSC